MVVHDLRRTRDFAAYAGLPWSTDDDAPRPIHTRNEGVPGSSPGVGLPEFAGVGLPEFADRSSDFWLRW